MHDSGGHITIGTTVSELLPPLLEHYRETFPDSTLEISQ